MAKSCEYFAAILLIAVLLSGCGAPPQGMPPYLALVTPRIPDTIGQCTGIIVGPREVITPLHCLKHAHRVVTVTGQETWVLRKTASASHDLALLTTDRVLWVSEFAQFANPELGVQATLYGYSSYTVSHVARHAYYNGLFTLQIEGWPSYDYGQWIMTNGKVYGGDSGSPVLQHGKVVGMVSLANTKIHAGKIAYTVPVEFIRELLEKHHAEEATVQAHH